MKSSVHNERKKKQVFDFISKRAEEWSTIKDIWREIGDYSKAQRFSHALYKEGFLERSVRGAEVIYRIRNEQLSSEELELELASTLYNAKIKRLTDHLNRVCKQKADIELKIKQLQEEHDEYLSKSMGSTQSA